MRLHEHLKSRFCPFLVISTPPPPGMDFPKPALVFTARKKVGNGKLQMTFCCLEAKGPIPKIFRLPVSTARFSPFPSPFPFPVSSCVSRPIKKPQSGKVREGSGKQSGKGHNLGKAQAQELKTEIIYI